MMNTRTTVLACPACGGTDMEAVTDGEDTNFLCLACWRCWHVELGWASRVDADTCPGCPHHSECLERRPPAP